MKILLVRYHDNNNINSREIKNVTGGMGIWPPLGLLYLGATLKKHGYEVEILDVVARRLDSRGAGEAIFASRADLVGITATTPEIRGVAEAAHSAKGSGAKVVIGGPHLEIFPDETLSSADVDFAIQGDGEIPLLRLAEALDRAVPDFSKVPGLVYKKDGAVIKNGIYVETGLDDIPFPDWDLVNIHHYARADALSPLAMMVSARGCPYRCGFCFRGVNGMRTRFRDPVSIVDEMEYLHRRWKVREIIFCNDTLTVRRDHIMAMCEEVLRRDLKIFWQGSTRVDAVDPEMLKIMKRAGCKQLKFGIESGSEEILKLMQKGISKEQAVNAFRRCKKEKIRIGAYFIIGYAKENECTIQETIDFAKELDPDFVMFYAGIPLPNTDFHKLAVEEKKVDPDYWRNYVLGKNNDRIPYLIPDMEKWIRRAFRSFYGRPSFLIRKLLNVNVWWAAMKNPRLIYSLFFPTDRRNGQRHLAPR